MRRQKRSLDRAQHGYDTAVYTETDPPRGSTGPGLSLKATTALFFVSNVGLFGAVCL